MKIEQAFDKVENEFSSEEKRLIDTVLKFVLIKHARKINEGNEGVILYTQMDKVEDLEQFVEILENNGFDISKEQVLKVLKVYSVGAGKKEYIMQKFAYDLLKQQDSNEYAKIPKPNFFYTLDLKDELQTIFKNNFSLSQLNEKVEILLMEYVPGFDIRTWLYQEVIRLCSLSSKYEVDYNMENVRKWDFDSLENKVADLLKFYPKESDTNKNELVMNKNDEKMFAFLLTAIQEGNFSFNEKIIDKMQSTIEFLNDNGICLRDAHLRNFIINPDDEKKCDEVYFIDFGKSIKKDRPIEKSDYVDNLTHIKYNHDLAVVYQLRELVVALKKHKAENQLAEIKNAPESAKRLKELVKKLRLIISRTSKGQHNFEDFLDAVDQFIENSDDGLQFNNLELLRVLMLDLIEEQIILDRGMFAYKDVHDSIERYLSTLKSKDSALFKELRNLQNSFAKKKKA